MALAGTWALVAADDLQPDGRRTPAYGRAPSSLLMIDAAGRYSLQIFRADRPVFAAGTKARGTAAEYEAAVLGMGSHIGHCAIDPVSRTLDFHIEAASYPNWTGTDQKRQFTLTADELSYQVPATAAGTVAVPISVAAGRGTSLGTRPAIATDDHQHDPPFAGEHSHGHRHEHIEHAHMHAPDVHHDHHRRSAISARTKSVAGRARRSSIVPC